eukprot:3390124-Rhodomonas_salina.1
MESARTGASWSGASALGGLEEAVICCRIMIWRSKDTSCYQRFQVTQRACSSSQMTRVYTEQVGKSRT